MRLDETEISKKNEYVLYDIQVANLSIICL